MKQTDYLQLNFRKSLFWDVDFKKLDYVKDAGFIVGRVLDSGNLKEWRRVRDFYGLSEIKKMARKHIFSDERNVNFWTMAFNFPKQYLLCTRKPSLKTPKAFLKH